MRGMQNTCQSINIRAVKSLKRIASWLAKYPAAVDTIAAVVLSILALLDLYVNWGSDSSTPAVVAIGLTLLVILPFALRRRYPLPVLLVITAAFVAYRSTGIPKSDFAHYAFLLAFFSAGVYGLVKWRQWTRGISAVVVLAFLTYSVFFVDRSWIFPAKAVLYQASVILIDAFLLAAAWWVGDVFRIRREREYQLTERTVQLEKERDENARRAVIDERVRIARELHDVVAHHVSVMGIQAGAARRLLQQQPEKANELLSQIESSSRQAVAEMHNLLGLLRQENQSDELAPQPGLHQLDALVNHMRAAGLTITVDTEGTAFPLPPGIDLSAYRIVQEALTNCLKHAGTCNVKITLRYLAHAIELEILDDGKGMPKDGAEVTGRGIIGMRERVNLHGGQFTAGRIDGAGFRVKAVLPLTGRAK
jgi:signal transduction histidine kinase